MSNEGADNRLQGNPTILVVDDDELMREVCSVMVADAGGQCLLAVDGVDGVERFADDLDKIKCVVLDFTMPRLNGYETFLGMQKMKPDFRAVMVSGLNRTPEVEELCRSGEIVFLRKPFRAEQLIGAIKQIIGPKSSQ